MKKYIISVCNGKKDKYNAFRYSVNYIAKNKFSCGIIAGIYKRPFWYIDKKNINLGYLYISLKNLYKLFI